ncbi:class I SAM-dependent methyltransferase [Roseiflexus sp.]|uniref:class I SAM-dependent methyltransferase n=1 Tax=Roseiflexus sp. TaxID=2562120 RepID=UPI00398A768C
MSEYDAIARFYDADHSGFADDLPFYRELARRTGGRVLDVMCGSGRVLVPLAQAGIRVTGIDSSAAMIERAHISAATAGISARVDLHHSDARNPLPPGPYNLAIVALNSFMHLTTIDDQLAALTHIHRVLTPSGLLAIDVFNPHARNLSACDGELVLDRTFHLEDGVLVCKFVAQRADMAQQMNTVTFVYDELDGNGRVHRTVHTMMLRWFYRYELEHLLERAGFAVEAVYGSYDLDPFESDSAIMLAVARRKGL